MSNPTTPLSRNRIASSAISSDRACMPHRGDQAAHRDGAALGAGGLLAVGETGEHRIDDRVQRQPGVDVQFGREPDLGVHHVVGREVLDALVGHPVQGLGCLHHPDGVRERLQIAHQRSAVRGGAEERSRVRRRRWRAGRHSRSPRPAPARWPGAARRRGGRAAAPWAPAGSSPASTASSCQSPLVIRSMISGRSRRRLVPDASSRRRVRPSRPRAAPASRCTA